ncbi:uncharacterized protein LOC113324926 [Papaver somniferum]|uniref:uncharacterized protein LOC113324926 n=1 Tax=Papaver somniferum TaxID=3469 RepID=UPI000E702972|nr:uncharacterized protein LOC113324926 [Papaver somniferum]
MKMKDWFIIPSIGRSGGIAIAWTQGVSANLISFKDNVFNFHVLKDNMSFNISFVYGALDKNLRIKQWEFISNFSDASSPWCLIGDMDFILHKDEKEGGNDTNSSSLAYVYSCIQKLGLVDLKFTGLPFTWTNKRTGKNNIQESINRTLVNHKWLGLFPRSFTNHLTRVVSDHAPIMLEAFPKTKSVNRPYRYMKCWQEHKSYSSLIENSLEKSRNSNYDISDIVKRKGSELKIWNRKEFGNIFKNISDILNEIEIENRKPKNYETKKSIEALHNDLNSWSGKLKNIYQTNDSSIHQIFSSIMKPKINQQDNISLCSIPEEEEIREALFSMNSWGAPGPDGFPPGFYQNHWSELKTDIDSWVQIVFRDKKFKQEMNHTSISLTPKTKTPKNPSDFCPISLINALYKIVAKIIANRIKPHLDKLISQNQSAFIPKRQITDNIIVEHEILHTMKTSKKKNGYMAVKLDLSKAFDRLEWNFIIKILEVLGFSKDFCDLIFTCISSISYAVLVNGIPGDFFFPSRGIRQGYPLSPALFIICMEALSSLLLHAEQSGGTGRCSSSDEAEARACQEATRWARISGMSDIIFLNDNLNVINGMRGRDFAADWRCKVFIDKALETSNSFTSSSFYYVKRDCNFIADGIAKKLNWSSYKDIDSRSWNSSLKFDLPRNVFNLNNVSLSV